LKSPHWRTVLTTKDKTKAEAMAKEIGEGAQIEEIKPKVKNAKRPDISFSRRNVCTRPPLLP
jgi:hypothetical protein